MPMEHVELRKVRTEADDDSADSLNERYTEPMDSEKVTISSQFCDEDCMENQKFLTNGVMKNRKYDDYQEDQEPGHTSFGMSVFNLSNAIMGSGILGLSYAMANTGILLFVVLLFAVAVMSLYSVHLLLVTAKEGGTCSICSCLQDVAPSGNVLCKHGPRPSAGSLIYEKLGERAFGWPGKIAAFGCIALQNIGAMSSYLFIVKYELPEVIRSFMCLEENSGEWFLNGNYLVVIVSLLIILPLALLKNLGYLGYTSGLSLSCMVFFLGAIIYKKTQLPCPVPLLLHSDFNHSLNGSQLFPPHDVAPTKLPASTGAHEDDEDMCQPKYFVFNSQTAYSVPILTFAFVCHPEILPIYSELKDRTHQKMQCVSNLSIFAMLIMYLLSALFGYLTFYENVEVELLHTFTKVYRFDTLLLMVRLALLAAVTLTVPIVLFPVRTSIITLLFSGRDFSWTRHILVAAAILVFNNLLVIFVPTIRDIFGFIGSSAATMLIFILPAAFYLRLVKLKSSQKIPAAIFLAVGIVFMIGSLSLIVLDWVHNPSDARGH
ncbi:sodium-coupled neutral amino acid transporter 4-like isoform X1 [Arapaima gigas]